MKLSEENYQALKKIQYRQKFGKDLQYPPAIDFYPTEVKTTCSCGEIFSMDKINENIYYECWNCSYIEYISPERKALLDESIKNMGKKT